MNNLENNLLKIDSEAFEIFTMVSENTEISKYKNDLLNMKLDILEAAALNFIISAENNMIEKYAGCYRKTVLSYIMMLVGWIVMIKSPLISTLIFVSSTVLSVMQNKKIRKLNEEKRDFAKNVEKFKEMKTVFANSRTFLRKHTNEEVKQREEDLQDKKLCTVELADGQIEINIDEKVVSFIPDDVQNELIKLLQKELKTDINDLDKLIEMYAIKEANKFEKAEEKSISRTRKK